jgi:hypothetical protein
VVLEFLEKDLVEVIGAKAAVAIREAAEEVLVLLVLVVTEVMVVMVVSDSNIQ